MTDAQVELPDGLVGAVHALHVFTQDLLQIRPLPSHKQHAQGAREFVETVFDGGNPDQEHAKYQEQKQFDDGKAAIHVHCIP